MSKRISAFSEDAMGTMDAVAMADAIAKKVISVEEITNAAIARAEQVNPELGAIVIKMYEDARQQKHLNKTGMLYGVPTFIKDNNPIKGYPTQKGNLAFKSKIAKKNSKFAEQLFSTGLNCLGKTTLPAFGFICSTENKRWGITRNPWNTEHTTGGSSSGSAALVASGVVPIASANDGAGSTRIPASCCGLVGLKPTRTRLPVLHGTEALPINIAYEGVLTRSVRDTNAFYAAIESAYPNYKLPKIGYVKTPIKRRLKIAFFENVSKGTQGCMDDDNLRVQMETATLLESLGHQIELIKIPLDVDSMTESYMMYYSFLAYMTVYVDFISQDSKVDKSLLDTFTMGLADNFKNNKLELIPSLWTLIKNIKTMEQKLFGRFDLLMSPVTTKVTPKIGYFSPTIPYNEIAFRCADWVTFLPIFNFSGAPAISLPLGTSTNNLPIGVQFVAPYGDEKTLLEFALEIEAAQPWKFIYNS